MLSSSLIVQTKSVIWRKINWKKKKRWNRGNEDHTRFVRPPSSGKSSYPSQTGDRNLLPSCVRIAFALHLHRVLFSATSCCCCWVTTPECRINGEILVGLWLGICSTRQPWTMCCCFASLCFFFCGCCQQFNSSRRRRRIMHITICTVHGWMDWAGRSNRIRIYRSRAGIRYGIGGGSGQIVSSWAIKGITNVYCLSW